MKSALPKICEACDTQNIKDLMDYGNYREEANMLAMRNKVEIIATELAEKRQKTAMAIHSNSRIRESQTTN